MRAHELLSYIKQAPPNQPLRLPARVEGLEPLVNNVINDDYRFQVWEALREAQPSRIEFYGWDILNEIHISDLIWCDHFIHAFEFMLQFPVALIHFDLSDAEHVDHVASKLMHFISLAVKNLSQRKPDISLPLLTCLAASATNWNRHFLGLTAHRRSSSYAVLPGLRQLTEHYIANKWYQAAASLGEDRDLLDSIAAYAGLQEGKWFIESQRHQEAQVSLNKVIRIAETTQDKALLVSAHYLIGCSFESFRDEQHVWFAIHNFNKVLELDSQYRDAQAKKDKNVAWVRRFLTAPISEAEKCLAAQQYQEASAHVSRAICRAVVYNDNAFIAQTYYACAALYMRYDNASMLAEATTLFTKLLEIDPAYLDAQIRKTACDHRLILLHAEAVRAARTPLVEMQQRVSQTAQAWLGQCEKELQSAKQWADSALRQTWGFFSGTAARMPAVPCLDDSPASLEQVQPPFEQVIWQSSRK